MPTQLSHNLKVEKSNGRTRKSRRAGTKSRIARLARRVDERERVARNRKG